jgi:glutamate-5-semialdehyde dehydrogenase
MIDASDVDFGEEYNDLIISIAVVPDMKSAIELINTKGSAHTDTIVTENVSNAQDFLNGVDSATVLHNASTRFSDGFEFGLGAEIGISTDRLHARGPMGLNELCTYKYIVHGKGEIRD